mgnify:CR=1 FL=1
MKKQYGVIWSISDLYLHMVDVRQELDYRIIRAYAFGLARGMKSDDLDWIIAHPSLEVHIQRDDSLRAYEVSFVVTIDTQVETPPSERYKLEEGRETPVEAAL